MGKMNADFALLGGLLLHFLLIQQGYGNLRFQSTVADADRTVVCITCEPSTLNYPKCPDKLNPNQTIDNAFLVDFCYQCFIEHTWANGQFKGERRGCLAGNVVLPGNCTYDYPIDGDFGGQKDDVHEVHEVCRCKTSWCNNVSGIEDLGGMGDIAKFPETTTLRTYSRAQCRGGAPFWSLLVGVAGIIYANLI